MWFVEGDLEVGFWVLLFVFFLIFKFWVIFNRECEGFVFGREMVWRGGGLVVNSGVESIFGIVVLGVLISFGRRGWGWCCVFGRIGGEFCLLLKFWVYWSSSCVVYEFGVG